MLFQKNKTGAVVGATIVLASLDQMGKLAAN